MSDFDKIIREKVEQFEVPYNDSHWAEMETKLDTIKAAKIKKTIFSSAAALSILVVIAYFIISTNTSTKQINSDIQNKAELVENNIDNHSQDELKTNYKNLSTNGESIISENNNTSNKNKEIKSVNSIDSHEAINNISNDNKSNKIIHNNNSSSFNEENQVKVNSDFIVFNNRICLGDAVTFESMENNRPVSYLWNFGDGTVSHEANPKHKYSNGGDYDVTLTLIDKETGTEHTSIQRNAVTILDKPKADFNYVEESTKHDDNKLKYPYTKFKIKNPIKENIYKWNFDNGKLSEGYTVKTIHEKANNYNIILTVKNSNGCTSEIEKNIEIKNNFTLYAPSALRINPDNPENGVFMPKALLVWDIPFEMYISDKTGKIIYKTSDKNEGWNGKLNNSGIQLNEGIYFWKIVTKDNENNSHHHHGEIQLIK